MWACSSVSLAGLKYLFVKEKENLKHTSKAKIIKERQLSLEDYGSLSSNTLKGFNEIEVCLHQKPKQYGKTFTNDLKENLISVTDNGLITGIKAFKKEKRASERNERCENEKGFVWESKSLPYMSCDCLMKHSLARL